MALPEGSLTMGGFIPSIRECLTRLDGVCDTPDVAYALAEVATSIEDGGTQMPELRAAERRLDELLQLAHHLAFYARGGTAPPATPPGIAKSAQAADAKATRPVPAEIAVPPGYIGSDEVVRRTGRNRVSLYNSISKGKFPKPVKRIGRKVYWLESAVDASIATRAAR
ncbi:MAG TPA: AlpA family phage regulatory protein [Albitalea sp.]|jgi:prophage regulatory protein|nr:AlpA family phage regulatory protein [Albitalea sp.]